MTTITVNSTPDAAPQRAACAGLTLVELVIATTLAGLVMAAVLSTFLFIGRTEINAHHYVTMEQQARLGLERFGQDVRMAEDIYWPDPDIPYLKLTLPQANGSGTYPVEYSYDNTPESPTYRCFVRKGLDPVTGVDATRALIPDVETFEFRRWKVGATGMAVNDYGTKQLQIRLALRRQAVTAAAATNVIVSARFILRNKSSAPST